MTVSQKYLEFISLVQALNTIVLGGDTAEVTLDGITKPSISKFLAQVNALTTAELQRLRDAINVVMNQQSVPTTIVTDGTRSQEWINSDFRAALQALNNRINTKGLPNGYASLDANGTIPKAQLPNNIGGQATETALGAAKIATKAIAQAGVNDTDFITALKLANTRQSVWVNKTGMLFGTTYMNTAPYEKEISFLSGLTSGLLLTAKVTFKNLTTNIETIVYFGAVSNWTGGIASSANFTVPPNTSFKIEIVRTDSLSTVVTLAVDRWSERHYV